MECRPPGQAMEVPDHNGVGYSRGPQGDAYRSRGQLQRHHTIQTCDDAYVSESPPMILLFTLSRLNTFCYEQLPHGNKKLIKPNWALWCYNLIMMVWVHIGRSNLTFVWHVIGRPLENMVLSFYCAQDVW